MTCSDDRHRPPPCVTAEFERPETKTWPTDGRTKALFAAVLAG